MPAAMRCAHCGGVVVKSLDWLLHQPYSKCDIPVPVEIPTEEVELRMLQAKVNVLLKRATKFYQLKDKQKHITP